MNRRQTLKSLLALSALSLNSCSGIHFRIDSGGNIDDIDLPKEFDEIDHFQVPHAIRDGQQFSIPEPSLYKEIVIVGGGISGLTALKHLTDYDVLLIEKENKVGGNSRRRQANGIDYPLGAILNQGPIAPFTEFFDELAIPFQKLNGTHLNYFINGQTVPNPLDEGWQQLPLSASERRSFHRLAKELMELADPVDGIFFPRTDNKQSIKELDRLTFKQYLASNNYSPAAQHFMNLMLSSRLGENGDNVSAWIALYILSTLKQPAYTLPGGHGAISEILRNDCLVRKSDSIKTAFTVINVENKPNDKVWVTGVFPDDSLQTIAADCVVMATPKVYAKHAVQGLIEARPKLYDQFNYNAYLVAQIELNHRIAPAFETVSASHFSRFIVSADWLPNNRSPNGSGHLTVYVPYPGVAGRFSLYEAYVPHLAQTIINDLHEILPETKGVMNSVYLHRWGHPMVSCAPGMDTLCDNAKQPFGRIVFAHSDSFGISGLYSAVWSGMEASMEAQIILME